MERGMIFFVAIILTSCNLNIAGTLGGGDTYRFNCTEEKLNFFLDSIEEDNLSLKIPEKWIKYDNWEQKGYGFLNGKVYYIKGKESDEDEMYYVSVIPPKENFNKNPGTSVRSVFRIVKSKPRWLNLDDLYWWERRGIEEKFQEKVLSQLPLKAVSIDEE